MQHPCDEGNTMQQKNLERDAIDFGRLNIPSLFIRLFVPTLLGLLFSAVLNLADGIFVGRGVGSDALAAINVAAPIFMVCTGLAMMFGSGVSVVAALHLSHGNIKAANINMTQAVTVGVFVMTVIAAVVFVFPELFGTIFGGSPELMPYVVGYLRYITPGLPFIIVLVEGMFILRLDGAPNIAMGVNIAASILNIFLDWLFVFPFGWGIEGAAFATTLSQAIGALLILYYLFFRTRTLHFYRPKFSRTAIRLTVRNVGYMSKLGASTLLGELALSFTMVVGNYAFIGRLHEDGVAAFSVTCYLCPLIFMFGNSIAQAALPIMTFNYGAHNTGRVRQTVRLALLLGAVSGILMTLCGVFFSPEIVSLFLEDGLSSARLAVDGYPVYASCIMFFTLNIVAIGLYQSVEKPRAASVFMLLRGFIFLFIAFMAMPRLMGDTGLWLAIPVTEAATFLVIVCHAVLTLGKKDKSAA